MYDENLKCYVGCYEYIVCLLKELPLKCLQVDQLRVFI